MRTSIFTVLPLVALSTALAIDNPSPASFRSLEVRGNTQVVDEKGIAVSVGGVSVSVDGPTGIEVSVGASKKPPPPPPPPEVIVILPGESAGVVQGGRGDPYVVISGGRTNGTGTDGGKDGKDGGKDGGKAGGGEPFVVVTGGRVNGTSTDSGKDGKTGGIYGKPEQSKDSSKDGGGRGGGGGFGGGGFGGGGGGGGGRKDGDGGRGNQQSR